LKFQLLDFLQHAAQIAGNLSLSVCVAFFQGKLQQTGRILQPLADFIQRHQHGFEAGTFFPQPFGFLLVRPDFRVLELLTNLIQAIQLIIEVKDTPSAQQSARAGLL
jgi:hypothetical protein